ncbi:LOW QUALITY PROTEIN: uncharacterized protein GJ701_013187 [Geothlypis trichas]
MGRVLFVFQCATKRLFKTSKLVTKWNIHPAHGMALNSDMALEKQQCSNPTVSPHFETSCLPLTSSKTSEALLLKAEENQLQPDIKSVKHCLFIKWKEGQIREEIRSPRRTHKKWPHKRGRGCCCCWSQDCRRRLNQFSQSLHGWGGLSTPKSLLVLGRKGSGVTEEDRGLEPWVLCWMCREEAAEPSPCSIRRFYRKQNQLWLQNYGNLSYFLLTCLSSHPCSVGVAGREVSSGAGSCWGVLWARQGTAVRFGKRNPAGFCKQHSLCAAGECSQGSAQNSGIQ